MNHHKQGTTKGNISMLRRVLWRRLNRSNLLSSPEMPSHLLQEFEQDKQINLAESYKYGDCWHEEPKVKQNVMLFWFLVTLADHHSVGNWFWTPDILFITTRKCQISKIPSHKHGYEHCYNTRSPTIGLKLIASYPHEHRVGTANVYPVVGQHLLINLWKYCEEESRYTGKQIICMFFLVFSAPSWWCNGLWLWVMTTSSQPLERWGVSKIPPPHTGYLWILTSHRFR